MEGDNFTSEPTGTEESGSESAQNTCTLWGCGCVRETEEEFSGEDDQETCDCQCKDDSTPSTVSPHKKPTKYIATSSKIQGKKAKLRTSKDIYDRLKWDVDVEISNSNKYQIASDTNEKEMLDVSSVYIGYKDRFLGMCELPFEEYQPGGDIPFHRVYYFRTGGPPVEPFIGKDGEVKVRYDNLPKGAVFVWDRDSRTDLIFNSGNSSYL